MFKLFSLMLGGALGTLARYGYGGAVQKLAGGTFPFGTLAINLTGSFFAGLFWGLFEDSVTSPVLRVFVFIGILGGFTTFSTYALESFHLLRDGEYKWVVLNLLASNIGGILLVFAGYWLARTLVK
jgi:CrcB protein